VHLLVVGRVQGVGFRWYVREVARRRDLAGWVQNRPDGSVEVAAEGDEEAVEALVEAVRSGPPGATVTEALQLATEGLGALPAPFAIRK
jgi:acylphosphatase